MSTNSLQPDGPVKGGYYRHYKNKPYRVIDVVRHSETLEEMVLYEALYPNELGRLWVRPKEMFLESITLNGKLVPRFAYEGLSKIYEAGSGRRQICRDFF